MSAKRRLSVALAGVSASGYRSLALDYLHAAMLADPRLAVSVSRIDAEATDDPWWSAYRVLSLDPVPDIVALPVFCWTASHVLEVVRLLKGACPEMFVVLGGPEVGPIPGQVLAEQPGIDAVVTGEGESTFCDLLHSLARGGDVCGIPGVTARDGDRIVSGGGRPPEDDMDRLASPFELIPQRTDGSAYLETYRGCPHRCAYCYEGKGSQRIRSFSWERIASDIEAVAATDGMRAVSFIDPVFNLTTERLRRLASILEPFAARGLRLHTIEVDIERVDAEQAALLKRAGVVSVECGPQSVGDHALSISKRVFDRKRFAAGVSACKEVGISVECDLIIGLPGDTPDDVVAGIDYVTGLDPGCVQISTLHVLPGTDLWDHAEEHGLVFNPTAPHEVIATRELSFTDLRRLEVYGNAVAVTYKARIGQG
ncbi:MAG: B12-binding domain-containing radical SAM protein [Coriobacteriia bacterium]|nr:B12-binding domain-containing radical SAM protein [Coriobacteriia bacterium]